MILTRRAFLGTAAAAAALAVAPSLAFDSNLILPKPPPGVDPSYVPGPWLKMGQHFFPFRAWLTCKNDPSLILRLYDVDLWYGREYRWWHPPGQTALDREEGPRYGGMHAAIAAGSTMAFVTLLNGIRPARVDAMLTWKDNHKQRRIEFDALRVSGWSSAQAQGCYADVLFESQGAWEADKTAKV